MNQTIIPTYRIVASPVGIGWVAVEQWRDGSYQHVSSFRSLEAAQEFCESDSPRDATMIPEDSMHLVKHVKEFSNAYHPRWQALLLYEVSRQLTRHAEKLDSKEE